VQRRAVGHETLITPSPLACTANTQKLPAVLGSTKIPKSRRAKLKFVDARFYIGKGLKHKHKKTIITRTGKHKRVTITSYKPNATKDHVPATVELSLTGLKPGTHTLKVVASYKETERKHGHKVEVTVTKTLEVKFTVC
jgi:hypothetical protein